MSVYTSKSMGFVRVACAVADVIRASDMVKVTSSLTDLTGQFGEPTIFTEWGIEVIGRSNRVALREIRWPQDPDRDCEHWVPAPGFDFNQWAAQS